MKTDFDPFDLLQVCRLREYLNAWSTSADFKPIFAPEVLAIESYLRLRGLGDIVTGIREAQARNELNGMFVLDRLVKEGYLPG